MDDFESNEKLQYEEAEETITEAELFFDGADDLAAGTCSTYNIVNFWDDCHTHIHLMHTKNVIVLFSLLNVCLLSPIPKDYNYATALIGNNISPRQVFDAIKRTDAVDGVVSFAGLIRKLEAATAVPAPVSFDPKIDAIFDEYQVPDAARRTLQSRGLSMKTVQFVDRSQLITAGVPTLTAAAVHAAFVRKFHIA